MANDIGVTAESCIASQSGKFALYAWEPVSKYNAWH